MLSNLFPLLVAVANFVFGFATPDYLRRSLESRRKLPLAEENDVEEPGRARGAGGSQMTSWTDRECGESRKLLSTGAELLRSRMHDETDGTWSLQRPGAKQAFGKEARRDDARKDTRTNAPSCCLSYQPLGRATDHCTASIHVLGCHFDHSSVLHICKVQSEPRANMVLPGSIFGFSKFSRIWQGFCSSHSSLP
jgi:hypothetical protein